MTNSIRTSPSGMQARSLRQTPGWQIVTRYRVKGWTQWRIAKEAKTSQGTVAKAIYRRGKGPAIDRVWAVLERILRSEK